jgi:hypothetical protein
MALLARRAYSRTADGPAVRHVHGARTARQWGGAWRGANRRVSGRGAGLGKARGPRAARDLVWRGVGRSAGADAEDAGARARRRGAERGRPVLILLSLSLNTIYSKTLY